MGTPTQHATKYPDFEQLALDPTQRCSPITNREHAYGHFYNLARHVGDETGYVATKPEAERTTETERQRAFRRRLESQAPISWGLGESIIW